MSLQPVDGVLSIIMKVAETDERAAAELVRYSLWESLCDQIDAARPMLERDGLELMSKQAHLARTHLLRTTVGKALEGVDDEIDLDVAEGLAIIDEYVSKAGPLATVANWLDERRDKGGRWTKGGASNEKNIAQGADAEGNERPNISSNQQMLDRQTDRRGRAAVDAAGLFAGQSGANVADRMSPKDKAGWEGIKGDRVAEQWNRPSEGGDRQAYRRMALTGQALAASSRPGSTPFVIGGVAHLTGQLGPEAEKVLGPGVRRTAYRYRGTERRADPRMVKDVATAEALATSIAADTPATTTGMTLRDTMLNRMNQRDQGRVPPNSRPPEGTALYYAHPDADTHDWSQDRLELAVRGDTAALNLLPDVPDQTLAALSIAAGELPPSRGVMIDADGDVVSEAQGYNGDHYLPFDLKNLGDLHGGQYVRTRVAGGLTSEDLYTGLMSGARQMQVVSNSGVFTVELDPDIRGGRRYTDKARRMVDRYGKLLEAIDTGDIFETDVSPKERSAIRTEAYSLGLPQAQAAARFQEKLTSARRKATINQEDDELIHEQAQTEVDEAQRSRTAAGKPWTRQQKAQQYNDAVKEMETKRDETKIRQMVLDGKGYATAMTTLQQEFPFYIRAVRYETVREFTENRGGKVPGRLKTNSFARDRGYTPPGQTNASASLKLNRDYGKEGADSKKQKYNDARFVQFGQGPDFTGTRTSRRTEGEASAANAPATPGAARAVGEPHRRAMPKGMQRPPVTGDGDVLVPTDGDTITLPDLLSDDPKVMTDTVRALRSVKSVINKLGGATGDLFVPEDESSTDENAQRNSRISYAHYVANKFGDDGEELADWLTTKADPKQRKYFVEGAQQAYTLAQTKIDGDPGGVQLMSSVAADPEEFKHMVDQIGVTVSLVKPFADPKTTPKMILAQPKDGPQPFPSIMALGNIRANYGTFLNKAEAEAPALAAQIKTFATASDTTITDAVSDKISEFENAETTNPGDSDFKMRTIRDLENMQRAWSFTAGLKIAEVVDRSNPKEPAAKRLQEPVVRRLSPVNKAQAPLVWLGSDHPFAQAVHQRLGIR